MDWAVISEKIAIPLTVSLGRGVVGWIQSASADGKIDWPEIKQLGETIIRISSMSIAVSLGFNLTEMQASMLVTAIDMGFSQLKKVLKAHAVASASAHAAMQPSIATQAAVPVTVVAPTLPPQ